MLHMFFTRSQFTADAGPLRPRQLTLHDAWIRTAHYPHTHVHTRPPDSRTHISFAIHSVKYLLSITALSTSYIYIYTLFIV